MKYFAYNSNTETNLSELQDSITFLNNIGEDKVTFGQERNKEEAFNGYLRSIKKGNKYGKQNKKHYVILICFIKARNNAIKFLCDYSSIVIQSRNFNLQTSI